jgi:hypothetical protein
MKPVTDHHVLSLAANVTNAAGVHVCGSGKLMKRKKMKCNTTSQHPITP